MTPPGLLRQSVQVPRTPVRSDEPGTVLVAHPSAECYGSDLQMLETVRACVEDGSDVVVTVPVDGPLVPLLRAAGAQVLLMDVPVLRRALLNPAGLLRLALSSWTALRDQRRMVRRVGATALVVNTVTIPTWLLTGWVTGVPTVCHVHEAEDQGPRLVRTLLAAPLLFADRVVVNSRASLEALTRVLPRLRARARVVHNGVAGPVSPVPPARQRVAADPAVVVLVGRLSPRKGTDVALAAVATLRRQGRDVRLVLAGTAFAGYEWFVQELRERACAQDLDGAVEFLGYADRWECFARADVVLVPSRAEPFGNVAVEAMLAGRPVVASRVQGLVEVVRDEVDGHLVEPGDAEQLALGIARVLDDPARAGSMAERARRAAQERFAPEAYKSALRAEIAESSAAVRRVARSRRTQ